MRLFAWALRPEGTLTVVDPELRQAVCAIDVPVFIGFGSTDMSPDPHLEPGAYQSSTDVTLFVLPESGHCFNFAPTRRRFFVRPASWVSSPRGALDTEYAASRADVSSPLSPQPGPR